MIVTDLTKRRLKERREDRQMKSEGYRKHETDWEVNRSLTQSSWIILDAKISVCGKYVWTKIGPTISNEGAQK